MTLHYCEPKLSSSILLTNELSKQVIVTNLYQKDKSCNILNSNGHSFLDSRTYFNQFEYYLLN